MSVEDVVAGGGAGEGVERSEGLVEVEENHLVGDVCDCGVGCTDEGGERRVDGLLLAEVGEQRGFGSGGAGCDEREDGCAKFWDAVAGERGGFYWCGGGGNLWCCGVEVVLVDGDEERAM